MISVESLLEVLKVSPVPLALIGNDKGIPVLLFANTRYLKLLGLSGKDVFNKKYKIALGSALSPEDIRRLEQSFKMVFTSQLGAQNAGVKLINLSLSRDDQTKTIFLNNTPIIEGGEVKYISQTISTDIPIAGQLNPELERAFQQIKENEIKLLASQKIAKVGYWQSFPDKRGIYWSDEVYNIWERKRETFELDFESHLDTIHPDDREEFLSSRERAFKAGSQHDIEHRIILPDGSIKWVHALGNLIRNEKGEVLIFEGTVQDITKDKLAMEKLLVSEARHRGILESQTNYMIRTDLQGNYSFYNNKFLQDFGWLYAGYDIIGASCLSSIMSYHHSRVKETVALCIGELNKVFQVFLDKPREDGIGVLTTLWDFICLTDSKGQPSEIQCIGIDVSEWEKAQRDLEESNTRYEFVTQATSDAIWDWDLRTDRVYRGNGFKALFGYPGQTVESRNSFWEENVHPDDIEAVRNNIEKFIAGRQQRWSQEYRFRKSSGEYAFVHDKGILIKDKEGLPSKMVGAVQDITERKIAEKQKELEADISQLFNSPGEHLNDILNKVLYNMLEYGDIALAEIWLLNSDKLTMNLVSTCTKNADFDIFYQISSEFKSFPKGEGIPGKVWDSGTFFVWENIDVDPEFPRHKAAKKIELKTLQGMPLMYNEELIGVLGLGIQKNGKNFLEHKDFREKFCRHLSSEIKRKQLDQELNQIFQNAPDVISVADYEGYFRKINPAACLILEYSEKELLSLPARAFVHPDDQESTKEFISSLAGLRETFNFENRYISKSGKVIWFAWTGTTSPEDKLIYAVAKDVTEKKNLEVLLDKSNRLAEIGSWEYDVENDSLYWGEGSKMIYETGTDFVPDMERWYNFSPDGYNREAVINAVQQSLKLGHSWDMEIEIISANGNRKWIRSIGEAERVKGLVVKLYGSFQNISNRKVAELELLNVYNEKNSILESIGDGFFAVDQNWVVNYWNKEAEGLLGKTKKEMIGTNLWEVFSHMTASDSYVKYQEAINTNQVVHFVDHYPDMNKWYEVSAYPSADGLSVFFKDITERKIYDIQVRELNRVLRNKVKELGVSNRELEQFAYVASHDLQEPLRMISSFLTQLQRKYNDQLDVKAHQYINFAVDGARRMRQIILDLLDFSRVGRFDMEKETISVNSVINEVIALCRKQIEETGTLLAVADMPEIVAPKTAIRQLFQNLVSNAIKYQLPGSSPLVEIAYTENPDYWQFSVKDNGIGISSDYFEKIFIIFQRLHTKDHYSGTGMGLAICRKIVENLGGRLWLESEEGQGSIFYFTVPKAANTK